MPPREYYHGAERVQESELANLLRDWLHARADLVGELLGADGELLEAKSDDDGWSIRSTWST